MDVSEAIPTQCFEVFIFLLIFLYESSFLNKFLFTKSNEGFFIILIIYVICINFF